MTDHKDVVSIVVPTFNERQNVGLLYNRLDVALAGVRPFELIFVDDNSPDGTSDAIKDLARADPRVVLIQREGKAGLGTAVLAGFTIAKGDLWVMMDADLSHRPEDLPRMLDTLADADIVVGSRYIPGGQVVGWPLRRRVISLGAAIIGRRVVGLKTRDLTSGYAAFRRDAVAHLLPTLSPKGFKLLLEILAASRDKVVKESPVMFVERQYGVSKLSSGEVFAYLAMCRDLRRRRNVPMRPKEPQMSGRI